MKIWRMMRCISLTIFGLIFLPRFAAAFPMHTPEELVIWQQRSVSGPYRTTGDVSTNSPNDWLRMLGNANTFVANPTADRWTGWNSASSCVGPNTPSPGAFRHTNLKDAAFVWRVTGTSSYLNAVRNELIFHAQQVGTDFSRTQIWCANGQAVVATAAWDGGGWMMKLAVAYALIRGNLSGGDQSTLDAWFQKAMNHYRVRVDTGFTSSGPWNYYVSRLTGNWTLTSLGQTRANTPNQIVGGEKPFTHFGGHRINSIQGAYNNRAGDMVALFGVLGTWFNNAAAIHSYKTWIKEAIQFATFPDGTYYEFNRWSDTVPNNGLGYTGNHWGTHAFVIDQLARKGDIELLEYQTTNGAGGANNTTSTAGGPKSYKRIVDHLMLYVDGRIERYGTDQSSRNGNPNYRIRPNNPLNTTNQRKVYDVHFAISNLFWKDPEITSRYTRQAPGSDPYAAISGNTARFWGGSGGKYPGILLMAGQLEGVVDPYDSSVSETGLIREYLMNNSADDSSGEDRHGTPIGTSYDSDVKVEGTHSLRVDAPDNRFQVPMINMQPSQGSISLCYRPSEIIDELRYAWGYTNTPAFSNRIYGPIINGQFYIRMGSGSEFSTGYHVTLNTWSHLGVSWSGSNAIPYADGVALSALSFGGLTPFNRSTMDIANVGSLSADQAALGHYDHVRIWNRVATPEEMQEEAEVCLETPVEPPPPPLPPTEFSIDSCEIGAVSNTRVVSTLPAINPGETYDPNLCTFKELFTINTDATENVPLDCSLALPGGPLTLDLPNAPTDDTVQVQVFWQKGTINEVASPVCVNTITVPLPPKAELVQLPGWRFEGCGRPPGGLWHGRAGEPLRTSSPTNCLRIRVGIGNLSDEAEEPPSRFAPWVSRCDVNEECGEFQRMTNEFGTLGMRFAKDAVIEQEQATTDLEHFILRPVGGVTFAFQEGGRYQAQNITSSDTDIQPESAVVQVIEAQLAPNLPLGTQYKFCMRQEPEGTQLGEALENCEDDQGQIPVSIIVDRGFSFGG